MTGVMCAVLGSAESLSAVISPASVSGTASVLAPGTATATTGAVTITARGGVAPYTFSYTYVSGDVAVVLSPTASSTQFRRSVAVTTGQFITRTGVYRGVVMDAAATIFNTSNVTVITEHEGI